MFLTLQKATSITLPQNLDYLKYNRGSICYMHKIYFAIQIDQDPM